MGWIYVLDSGIEGGRPETRLFKIGKAKVLDKRIKQLKIQLPYKVRIEYAFEDHSHNAWELIFHSMFRMYRRNGEWFELGYRELTAIAELSNFSGFYERDNGELVRDAWRWPEKESFWEAEIELQQDAQWARRARYMPLNRSKDIPSCPWEMDESIFSESESLLQ